jgi:hypothetical protein
MLHQAEALAQRLRTQKSDPASQVDLAFALLLSRSPNASEKNKLSEYASRHGLEAMCRLMFNLNEFAFVD